MRPKGLVGILIILLLALIPMSCSKQKERGQAEDESATTGEAASANATAQPAIESIPGLIPAAQRASAPQIDAQVVDGSSFSLAGHKGKVVLVDFWATWCPPCRKAIPHLIDLQNEYGSRGVQVIGISLDQQGKPVIDPYVQSAGINYPIIADPQGNYANLYGGVEGIPALFILDKSGRIADKIEGYTPKEAIERVVKSLLAEG